MSGSAAEALERRQAPILVVAIAVGLVVGSWVPGVAWLHALVEPGIALLLLVTFLAVPIGELGRAWRDWRLVVALAALQFTLLPIVVASLALLVDDAALRLGVLLVLLAPCIDYVVAFTRLAGGAHARLLAMTPLLLGLQLVLLGPLVALLGGDARVVVDPEPLVRAALLLVLLPLAVAAALQALARRIGGVQRSLDAAAAGMVPITALVLVVVVASQTRPILDHLGALLGLVPLYVGFAVAAVVVGIVVARVARLDVPGSRTLVLSGVTRNSLVVLPIALALPEPLALAAPAVVLQTLVELVLLVVLVRLVPRIVPDRVVR